MRRSGIIAALAVAPILMGVTQGAQKADKLETFFGKVVSLADHLGKAGIKLDADASPYWLALITEDNKVYPLIKDTGARMFFKDNRLLNRPMRLTGKLIPGTAMLQVINVHSVKNGEIHEVFYWCDICTIRTSELDICDCCGGPMELREPPLRK